MAKQTEEKKKTGINVTRAIAAASRLLDMGWNEMRFQNMLDRYQLANLKADFSDDARVKRAEKLRKDAEELDAKFRGVLDNDGHPIARVSNWNPLANYFNETLAHVKESDFAAERDERIERDVKRAGISKVTKEQEQVITLYHTNKVKQTWEKVLRIRAILEQKGLLKKAPAKLPTEEELAKIAENQQ